MFQLKPIIIDIIINGEINMDLVVKQKILHSIQQIEKWQYQRDQRIIIVNGIKQDHGVNKMIYGEKKQIQKLQDNDHVQQIGMCQVVENGSEYMMHGIVEMVNHERIDQHLQEI